MQAVERSDETSVGHCKGWTEEAEAEVLEQNSVAEPASLAGMGRPARYQRQSEAVHQSTAWKACLDALQIGPDGEHDMAEAD